MRRNEIVILGGREGPLVLLYIIWFNLWHAIFVLEYFYIDFYIDYIIMFIDFDWRFYFGHIVIKINSSYFLWINFKEILLLLENSLKRVYRHIIKIDFQFWKPSKWSKFHCLHVPYSKCNIFYFRRGLAGIYNGKTSILNLTIIKTIRCDILYFIIILEKIGIFL